MVLMSTLDALDIGATYPELAGKRVLLTGLAGEIGAAIIAAFAAQRTRLAVHLPDDASDHAGLLAATELALDAHVITGPAGSTMDVARLVRAAIAKLGGIDMVINVVDFARPTRGNAATSRDVDAIVADGLRAPCVISRIAANRMRLTWTRGTVLNVLAAAPPAGAARIVWDLGRASLAAMTRVEAQAWAGDDIRINAVVAGDSLLDPAPSDAADVAAFAVHLASGRDHDLSGLTLTATSPID